MGISCPYEKPFDYHQGKIAYICISAFSGSLSIIGSSLILYTMSHGGWTRLSRPRNRLLFGMSVIDIFSSAAYSVSIIPTPQETECAIGMGNLSTCNAQGFLIQLGFAGPAYNAMLSIYYLLTIRYGITQTIIAEKYEVLMHVFALVPTLTTAIIGVVKKMYFSEAAVCWIGDICQSFGNCPTGNVWGRGIGIFLATTAYMWLCTTTTVCCMIFLSWTLKRRNLASSQYRFPGVIDRLPSNRRLSELEFASLESAKQAYLYSAAFIFTYVWGTCGLIVSSITGKAIATPWWYHYHLVGFFLPLQGLWNFLAYVRPQVSNIQRDRNDDNISFIAAVKMIVTDQKHELISADVNTTQVMASRRYSLTSL